MLKRDLYIFSFSKVQKEIYAHMKNRLTVSAHLYS